jgi:hypothetical protein
MNEKSVRTLSVRVRRAAVLLAFAAAVVFEPSRAAGGTTSLPEYHYLATHCENTYYFVPTTAERARDAGVPARFAILGEAAGVAVVGVLFVTCDVSLNDGPAKRTSWSEAGVLIEPPNGVNAESVTIDIYRTWHVTDRREWLRLNRAWGIPTADVDVDTSYAPGVPLATSVGYVDDPSGAYGHQGYFEGIVHPGAPGVVSWWTLGKEGLVRFDQEFTNDTEQCGVGAVTAEGRMAALVGASSVGIHGCVVFADLIGNASLIEEP